MKPRYKIISLYPNSEYQEVGEIREWIANLHVAQEKWCNYYDSYPHLFKKLEWWQERTIDEMPEYVKCLKTPDQKHFENMVYKVRWKIPEIGFDEKEDGICPSTNCYIPSNIEEYNTYIQSKQ